MKPLRKSERRRFEDVCRKIREALHLEHKDYRYDFVHKEGKAEAGTRTMYQGWYVRMEIYPHFWETSTECQLRTLIHEHIHVCLVPFQQQVDFVVGRLHTTDKELAEQAVTSGLEITVSHQGRGKNWGPSRQS